MSFVAKAINSEPGEDCADNVGQRSRRSAAASRAGVLAMQKILHRRQHATGIPFAKSRARNRSLIDKVDRVDIVDKQLFFQGIRDRANAILYTFHIVVRAWVLLFDLPRRGNTMSNPWWSSAQHCETWGDAVPQSGAPEGRHYRNVICGGK
jgi:hypothetical protein